MGWLSLSNSALAGTRWASRDTRNHKSPCVEAGMCLCGFVLPCTTSAANLGAHQLTSHSIGIQDRSGRCFPFKLGGGSGPGGAVWAGLISRTPNKTSCFQSLPQTRVGPVWLSACTAQRCRGDPPGAWGRVRLPVVGTLRVPGMPGIPVRFGP